MQPAAVLCLTLVSMVRPSRSQQPLTSDDPQQKTFSPVSHPSWSLGLQVFRALRTEGSHINTFISPVLLANSLSALSHTAKGATARQLQELLKTYKDEKQAEKLLSSLFTSMRKANGTSYTLHGSSAFFSKQVPTLKSEFLEELQARFELDHVPLGVGDKQKDMKKLSSWAKTGMGGVKVMPLNGGPDAKEGALILASALYFKGFWDRGFNEENKDLRSFLGNKYTKVYMMHRTETVSRTGRGQSLGPESGRFLRLREGEALSCRRSSLGIAGAGVQFGWQGKHGGRTACGETQNLLCRSSFYYPGKG